MSKVKLSNYRDIGSSIYCNEDELYLVTNDGVFTAKPNDARWTQIYNPGKEEHFAKREKYIPSQIVTKSQDEFYVLFWDRERKDYDLYQYIAEK